MNDTQVLSLKTEMRAAAIAYYYGRTTTDPSDPDFVQDQKEAAQAEIKAALGTTLWTDNVEQSFRDGLDSVWYNR